MLVVSCRGVYHYVVCGLCLFSVIDFSFCETSRVVLHGLDKLDVTFLSVGVAVVIIQTPFNSAKMYLFVGGMDGKNFTYVIVIDPVLVPNFCIRQDIFRPLQR